MGEAGLASLAAETGVTTVRCDVTRAQDLDSLVQAAVDAHGRLDGAFNAAGILGGFAPTHAYGYAGYGRVMAVNAKGVWRAMRAELAPMLAQGSGAIVNCSSAEGLDSFEDVGAYAMSKAAVITLTRTAPPLNTRAKASA